MPWFRVAGRDEVPLNRGKQFSVNGRDIAVFNVDGRYYATEAYCRHQDAPLADGILHGHVLECFMHRWHYDIRDGRLLDHIRGVRLETYRVEVRDGDIYVYVEV
ncbi:MAG: Rieske 2Fe-2S domain-containing protein [Candidatus Nitrosocaldus sp.]|nr:Rieske 2Fe-2S domain-containing protein [Candidatus Nitrosocaldus sp.]MCS7141573.1 Rieske 2Fe-2S domain-containing protein [Candidatus Nitrosocaldus sp.]MDW8000494.1 Rieske 2Fe-2S domain-containing protein [Candidatus Nitrosocaldus sp.]MDW8275143.1 Rieske 2Fe-2S domain-containing protein [Candidatus Nitrosocaldus sp.]